MPRIFKNGCLWLKIAKIVGQYQTSNDRRRAIKGLYRGATRLSKGVVQAIRWQNDGGMYTVC